MWRSLFYAVGIGLFSLGLQTLVVEHVTVPKNTKFQRLMKKVFEDDKSVAVNGQPGSNRVAANQAQAAPNWGQQAQASNQGPVANQGYAANAGSRFGPSRFSGPAYGTGYGGSRVNANPVRRAPLFGGSQQNPVQNRTNAQFARFGTQQQRAPAVQSPAKLQKVIVREWMPWSLLASGAIVFLYTHTHQRRRYDD